MILFRYSEKYCFPLRTKYSSIVANPAKAFIFSSNKLIKGIVSTLLVMNESIKLNISFSFIDSGSKL